MKSRTIFHLTTKCSHVLSCSFMSAPRPLYIWKTSVKVGKFNEERNAATLDAAC